MHDRCTLPSLVPSLPIFLLPHVARAAAESGGGGGGGAAEAAAAAKTQNNECVLAAEGGRESWKNHSFLIHTQET